MEKTIGITEDYVSFEIAKLLKEKGFKGEFHKHYWGYEPGKEFLTDSSFNPEYDYPAPTLQMAMKWLRKKGLHIFIPLEIDYDEDERGCRWYHDAAYYPEIRRVSDGKIMYDDGSLYAKPEQAMGAAIKYCLENLI